LILQCKNGFIVRGLQKMALFTFAGRVLLPPVSLASSKKERLWATNRNVRPQLRRSQACPFSCVAQATSTLAPTVAGCGPKRT
jgi:hypothetical protein